MRVSAFYRILFALMVLAGVAQAAEMLAPVAAPANSFLLSGVADLRDDVYSGDVRAAFEIAPVNFASVFVDGSYRFKTYEFNTKLHGQIHELIDLRVEGLNATTVGAKVFPIENFGIAIAYTFPAREGNTREHHPKFKTELQSVFPLLSWIRIGYALEYLKNFERNALQLGDELGSKASVVLDVWGLELAYVFLFRSRVEESVNRHLAKPYRGMGDNYQGYRMHVELSKVCKFRLFSIRPGVSYEMSKGYLFGFETGHRLELFVKVTQ